MHSSLADLGMIWSLCRHFSHPEKYLCSLPGEPPPLLSKSFGTLEPQILSYSSLNSSLCVSIISERDEFTTGFSFKLPISTMGLAEQACPISLQSMKCPLSFVLHHDLEFTQDWDLVPSIWCELNWCGFWVSQLVFVCIQGPKAEKFLCLAI